MQGIQSIILASFVFLSLQSSATILIRKCTNGQNNAEVTLDNVGDFNIEGTINGHSFKSECKVIVMPISQKLDQFSGLRCDGGTSDGKRVQVSFGGADGILNALQVTTINEDTRLQLSCLEPQN